MNWQPATPLAELAENEPTTVRIDTTAVVLVRVGDKVHALETLCPHKFADLSEGTVEDGCLRCPQHEAHFSLETGVPREGEEWAGEVQTFPTRIQDGVVEIAL